MMTDPKAELAKLRRQCGFSPSAGNCGDDATIVSEWIKNALTKNAELVKECMDNKEAMALLQSVRKALVAAPELNPANWTEEDAFALNAAVCNVVCEIDGSGLNLCEEGEVP